MGFSKLHSSLVNSSLWTENDSTRILFITLLAICNRNGEVFGSRFGFARIAQIDPDDTDSSFDTLLGPDTDSSDKLRAPENEGRRLREIPGGFEIINYAYYRSLRDDDDRREQNRLAQARFKAKVSHGKPRSAAISPDKPRSAHAEAEAEAEAEEEAGEAPPPPPSDSQNREPVAGKPETKSILALYGIPTSPSSVTEWRGGLNRVARVRSEREAHDFLGWADAIVRKNGETLKYFRQVRQLAEEWDRDQHKEARA